MKTTQECWQALIDGEKLQHVSHPENGFVCLVDGAPVDFKDRPIGFLFDYPQDWSIYTPPKWYDNILECAAPCWVWDDYEKRKIMMFVSRYIPGHIYPFKTTNDNSYKNATPLTKQEIQLLLDNAPEGENGND